MYQKKQPVNREFTNFAISHHAALKYVWRSWPLTPTVVI